MKTMKHLIPMIMILSALVPAAAQQDPIYAQYLNNPLTINPAYAGSNNMFNAALQYRTQWAGLDANPVTVNFSSHMSLYQNRVGIGMMVVVRRPQCADRDRRRALCDQQPRGPAHLDQ